MDPTDSAANATTSFTPTTDAQTSQSSLSPPPSSSGPGPARAKRRRNTSATPSDCCHKVARTMPSRSHTEAGTVRKRAQRACSQCHAHKTKCSGDLPRCKRCEVSDLVCEYTPAKRKFTNVQFNVNSAGEELELPLLPARQSDSITSGAASAQTSTHPHLATPQLSASPATFETSNFAGEALLIRKDILQIHMNAYNEHLYNLPCYGFFHPARMRREIQEDRLYPGIAAGLCSATATILNPGDAGRDFARKCNDQVEFHIFRNMGNFCELSLTLILLGNHYNWIHGQWGKMWMYVAQAARLVHALQFNWDAESAPGPNGFVEQEIRRRLTWQTYLMDRLLSDGFDDYILCPDKTMYLRVPCDERSFQENRPVEMERLDQKPGTGVSGMLSLHSFHIRAIGLRHMVLGTTKKYGGHAGRSTQKSRLEPSQVMEDINKLQLKISSLGESLPVSMRLSDQSLQMYFASSERTSFVMLHTWIGHLYVDLYRFSLPDIREQASPELLRNLPPEFVSKSQKQAVAHAIGLSKLWEHMFHLLSSSSSSLLLSTDYMVAVCIFHTTQILFSARKHMLYTNLNENSTAPLWRDESVDDSVIDRLVQSNMAVMRPMADIIPRIKTFEAELVKKGQESAEWRDSEKETVGVSAVADNSHPIRLPGPHYILEKALLKQNSEPSPRNLYMSQWAQQTHDMQIFPPEKQVDFSAGPPELPFVLAQARGLMPGLSQPAPTRQTYQDINVHSQQGANRTVPVPSYGMGSQSGASQLPNTGLSSPLFQDSYGMAIHPQYQDFSTLPTRTYYNNDSSGFNLPSTRNN
ncbi:hypothetical protein MKZ38_005852 [Zalerion maritima]|uniref:Zn(2)-C6 fungal-type domain-containing protein n=1 Tax=Zalerion maritima TaxID=339359 RepID=A0AAD5WP16_9PEZI|nr:hypothetical protein MKZ38_005852 [Zalerion maritima]